MPSFMNYNLFGKIATEQTTSSFLTSMGNLDTSFVICNRSLYMSRDTESLEINNTYKEIKRTVKILPQSERKT